MDEIKMLKIEKEGYQPLHQFHDWKIAGLRYAEHFDDRHLTRLERHWGTDEVFILLTGQAALLTSSGDADQLKVSVHMMEQGQIYVIPRNIWHHILCDMHAEVLIMEEADTGAENSEYRMLDLPDIHKVQTEWEARAT